MPAKLTVNDLLCKQKFQVRKRQTYMSIFFKTSYMYFLPYYYMYFNLNSFVVYCATFNYKHFCYLYTLNNYEMTESDILLWTVSHRNTVQ